MGVSAHEQSPLPELAIPLRRQCASKADLLGTRRSISHDAAEQFPFKSQLEEVLR